MITLYSGTPGSGKSYHAAVKIDDIIRRGGSLICNFPVAIPAQARPPKRPLMVSYWDNSEITPDRLVAYAREHHTMGKEGQTLLIVDEAQVVWNCREFGSKDRKGWITFFSQHRKLGYDILLISQNDRMLDRQIRMLIEYEVKHRKVNNYGTGGALLSLVTGKSTWFVAMRYWYGGNKVMLDKQMIRYRKSVGALYDSYALFDTSGSGTLGGQGGEAAPGPNIVTLPRRSAPLRPFRPHGRGDDVAKDAPPRVDDGERRPEDAGTA